MEKVELYFPVEEKKRIFLGRQALCVLGEQRGACPTCQPEMRLRETIPKTVRGDGRQYLRISRFEEVDWTGQNPA
jgi:hypothetical protein